MTGERVTLPQLAERIKVNKEATDKQFSDLELATNRRFDKLEDKFTSINRAIYGSAGSIIVAVIIAWLTRGR